MKDEQPLLALAARVEAGDQMRERVAQAIHDSDDAIDTTWPLGPNDDGRRGDRQHVRLCRWPEMYLTAADAALKELGFRSWDEAARAQQFRPTEQEDSHDGG